MGWTSWETRSFGSLGFAGTIVWVVCFVLVGSHSSKLRIDHRLFFFIPDSFRKVLTNFESLSQWDGLVGKPDQSVH